MSVLFEALNRAAAEEQKDQPAAQSGAEIVTLFAPAPKRCVAGLWGMASSGLCVAGLACALAFVPPGSGLSFSSPQPPVPSAVVDQVTPHNPTPRAPETASVKPNVSAPAPKTQVPVKQATAALPDEPPLVLPAHVAKTPSGQAVHAKTIQSDPDGIALPVEALKEVRTTEHNLSGATKTTRGDAKEAAKAEAKPAKMTKAEKRAAEKARKKEALEQKKQQGGKAVVVTEQKEAAPDVALSSAHDLLEDGKYRAASQRYDEILSKDPHNKTALEGKVYALQQFPPGESVPALARITQANSDFAPAFAGLARAEARRGNDKAAIAAWRKASSLDSDNNLYRLSLAIAYDRAGQNDAALSAYRSLAQPWPKQVQDRVSYLSGGRDASAQPKADDSSDQP